MRKIVAAALCATLCSIPGKAQAWRNGSAPAPSGKAQINIGIGDVTAQSFINLWNLATQTFSSGATPAALDADMFPVRNFSGTISGQLQASNGTLSTTGPWSAGGDAGRSCGQYEFLKVGTTSNAVNVTVTNSGGPGNLILKPTNGLAWSVDITWANTNGVSYQFNGSDTSWGNCSGTGRLWLIRKSDQIAYNNGVYWTPEFVDFLRGTGAGIIRPMNLNIGLLYGRIGTNAVNWSYRRKTSALSFSAASDFPPGTRCGGSTSFCTISVSAGQATAVPADDTPLAGWVDGEQLTGQMGSLVAPMAITAVSNNGGKCQFTVADTTNLSNGMTVATLGLNSSTGCGSQRTTIATVDSSTQFTTNVSISATCASSCGTGPFVAYQTLTITGKAGGSKLMLDIGGNPIQVSSGACALASGSGASFTYNATLDAVLACGNDSGIASGVPIEVQVQLANRINANYWYNYPTFANDNFVTSARDLILSTLNSQASALEEWSNECWNFGQICAQFSAQMSIALGLSSVAQNNPLAYQSLRVRQINGLLGANPRFERTYCMQAASDVPTLTTQLNGSNLSSYGYNVTPNRPIDVTETICLAPYVAGGSAFSGQSPDALAAPSSFDAPLLNSVVSNWNGGAQSTAISQIDQSIRGDVQNRVQTVTASGSTFTTPLAHNLNVNDLVRFTVTGGTSYSGLNLLSTYQIRSVPTSTTFTAARVLNGVVQSTVNAGTAGSGTTSVGYLQSSGSGNTFGHRSIFGVMSGALTKFEALAANGVSPGSALGSTKVKWYEGNLEPTAPSTAQCAAIGINSTDCATLATALTAWKNSSFAAATTTFYFQVGVGTAAGTITTGAMPNTAFPSWYILNCDVIYALNSTCFFSPATPYQTYDGFAAFRLNWLLKRDIDPASNDNDPMWLEKVA